MRNPKKLILKDELDSKRVDFENCDFEISELLNYSANGPLNFNNSHFNNSLSFEGTTFTEDLNFSNVEFFSIVELKQVVIKNVASVPSNYGNLNFHSCVFHKTLNFYGVTIVGDVKFEKCTFKERVDIIQLKLDTKGLIFIDCTFESSLSVFDSHFGFDIDCKSNHFTDFISLNSVTSRSLSFEKNNVVNGNFEVMSCAFTFGIDFRESKFLGEINITALSTEIAGLKFYSSSFEKAVSVTGQMGQLIPENPLATLYIVDSNFLTGFFCTGSIDEKVTPRMKYLEIIFTPALKGNLSISNIEIGNVSISGYNSNATLSLENIEICEIEISGFVNNSGLIFSNLKAANSNWYSKTFSSTVAQTYFQIHNSNLGKAQLYSIDLQSFELVQISNAILGEISFAIVNWFTKEQLEAGQIDQAWKLYSKNKKSNNKFASEESKNNYINLLTSKKETYRQLKLVANRLGDLPQAQDFQRNEMEYYYKIVKYSNKKRISELLILSWSRSNNFGQNWIKAFFLLLLFSFIIYVPIGLLTSEELDYSKFARSLEDVGLTLKVIFCTNLKIWMVILNPTHRMSDITNNITNFWIYALDTLSRVFVSYFIFQTVSAFRKFVK